MAMALVTNHHRRMRVPGRAVRGVIKRCAGKLVPSGSVISIAFLDDKEMTRVNERYTGRRGATDVLSFPLGKDARDRRWHGEILISLDRAKRQAKEKGVLLIQEVTRLLIHALAHLSGLGHYDQDGFREMRRVEFGLLLKCL